MHTNIKRITVLSTIPNSYHIKMDLQIPQRSIFKHAQDVHHIKLRVHIQTVIQ